MRQLRPHQAANVEAIIASLKSHGGSLDASDTGTGKSTTFLAVCKAVGARPGIITRKAIIPAWHDECRALGVAPLFVTNYEAMRSGSFPFVKLHTTKTTQIRLNPATLMREPVEVVTKRLEWDIAEKRILFCFDEVQNCRGEASLNTSALRLAAARWKTCMASATPFTTPDEAYGVGLALRLFSQSSFYGWKLRHGMRKNTLGRLEFVGNMPGEKHREEGLQYMEAIHKAIFPSRGVRTTRYEIPGFPDELNEAIAVEVSQPDELQQMYLDLIAERRKQDYERACEGVAEDLLDLVEPLAITQNLRARQEAEIRKCPAIVELAQVAREKGEYVAVFVNFDDTIELLAKALDTRCIVRGNRAGENNFVRARWIREFQANRQPYILVNNQAGGAGVSLHDPITQEPRTSLISPPWHAIVLKQVLGRTLRLGGGFSTRKLLFAAGTVEERVMAAVQRSLGNLDMLTDGDLDIAAGVTR